MGSPVPQPLLLLLADFAASVELPELAFDEHGHALLRIGDSTEILLDASPAGLTLSADVGVLPPDRNLERQALVAGFIRDGAAECWTGLDPDSHLHLFSRLAPEGMRVADLEQALIEMMENVAQWRSLLGR